MQEVSSGTPQDSPLWSWANCLVPASWAAWALLLYWGQLEWVNLLAELAPVITGAAASLLVLGPGHSVIGWGNGGVCQGWGWPSARWGLVPGFLSCLFFFLLLFFFFYFQIPHIRDISKCLSICLAYFLQHETLKFHLLTLKCYYFSKN